MSTEWSPRSAAPQSVGGQSVLPRLAGRQHRRAHAVARREDGGGVPELVGDLLLLLDERRPIDLVATQECVCNLLVIDHGGTQRLDGDRLAIELTRSPAYLVDEAAYADDRGNRRDEQQRQHDRERSRPFTAEAPCALRAGCIHVGSFASEVSRTGATAGALYTVVKPAGDSSATRANLSDRPSRPTWRPPQAVTVTRWSTRASV